MMNNNIEIKVLVNKASYSFTIYEKLSMRMYDHIRVTGHDFIPLAQAIDNMGVDSIKIVWNTSEAMVIPAVMFDQQNLYTYMFQANMIDSSCEQNIMYQKTEWLDLYTIWCVDNNLLTMLNDKLNPMIMSNKFHQHYHPLMNVPHINPSSSLGLSDLIWIEMIDNIAHIKIYGHGAQLLVAESMNYSDFEDILYGIKTLSMSDDIFFNYRIMLTGDLAQECSALISKYYPRVIVC